MLNLPVFSTLRFKISLFVIILLFVTACLFSFITVRSMNEYVLNEIINRAVSLTKSMAAVAPYSVLSNDLLGIDNISWKVKEANKDVEYVAITDNDWKILSHTDVSRVGTRFELPEQRPISEKQDGSRVFEGENGDDGIQVHSPMTIQDRRIGTVVIGMNKSVLLEIRSETISRILAGLVVTMLIGVGCILILSSLITQPIRELAKGVDELTLGKKPKLHVFARDELGKLTASFNQMTEQSAFQQAKLRMYAQELEDSYVATVKVLTAAIDARDPYTLGHSTRVAKLAVKLGEAIGLNREELEDLEIASLFHDVGKLKTPDYVLLKEGPLSANEQGEISSHCEYGAAILSRAPSLQKYIPAVRHHHEWFNGEGYPDGLRGEDIPLHASIIAIADAFDAMTSVRTYKKSFSREDAIVELLRFSGRQFNPWLVEVFQTVLESDPFLAEQFSGREQ